MLAMADIRDYIASLEITEDDNVYIGKLDNKKEKSIGIYQRKTTEGEFVAAGGYESTTYEVKSISILIHWNAFQRKSEAAAYQLWERLKFKHGMGRINIGKTNISYIRFMVSEPQDIGTDDRGIYEYVIWIDLIYERREENANSVSCL